MDADDVARRCLTDVEFARTVLEGTDHQAVREAIIADVEAGTEVSGFFNPQPDPPGKITHVALLDKVSGSWSQLPLVHLRGLAGPT